MKKTINLTFGFWITFSFIFLPFKFNFLPNFGITLNKIIYPINEFICTDLLNIEIKNSYLISDSISFYSTSILLFIISIILSKIIQRKSYAENLLEQIKLIIFAILMFFLLYYGLDKIFQTQFYTPSSNVLHTEIRNLDKDILFWTTMGTSKFYNISTGIIEFTTGLLLLFNRTRFLGLLLSIGIFFQILLLNIGFDITVKYLSSLLLIASIYNISSYKKNLLAIIGIQSTLENIKFENQKILWISVIPICIELVITFYSLSPKKNGESYEVNKVIINNSIFEKQIKRIHIHPDHFLIIEDNSNQFKSFKLNHSNTMIRIEDNNYIPIKIEKSSIKIDSIFHVKTNKIRLQKSKVLHDQSKIYIEQKSHF